MSNTNEAQCGTKFLLKLGNDFSGAVTFTAATDLVGKVAHGLVVGQRVQFATVVTSTVPAIATDYYVIAAGLTADAFKVSTTPGGTTINIDADGTGTVAELFDTVGGMTTNSFSLGAEAVDITNKDSSHWKEILDGCGTKSATISGEGVFKDDVSFKLARNAILAQSLRNWRLYFNETDYWQGAWKLTALEQSGAHNEAVTYSISLESSGSISVVEA